MKSSSKYYIIEFSIFIIIALSFIEYLLIPSTRLISNYKVPMDGLPVIAWAILTMTSLISLVFPFYRLVVNKIAVKLNCTNRKNGNRSFTRCHIIIGDETLIQITQTQVSQS